MDGAEPRGWDDLWAAFVAVIREPLEEPDILRDDIWVEIVPPHPYDSPRSYALLSRNIGISGEDPDFNLEAQLAITAVWASADVEEAITTLTARTVVVRGRPPRGPGPLE